MRRGGRSPGGSRVLTLGGMYSLRPIGTPSLRLAGLSILSAATLLVAGCSTGNEPVKLTPAQAASSAAASSQGGAASTARPDPHAGAMGGAATAAASKGAGALQYKVPEGWVAQIPASSMRKAQFQLPKVEGDTEDAQLVLFHFGGEGGSIQANLDRWADYFVPKDGRTARDLLAVTTRTVSGMNVTEASISGTFDPSKVQGMEGGGLRENWSMLVAIVESPSGPYFARLLGPAGTLSRWDPSFREWISSMKPTN